VRRWAIFNAVGVLGFCVQLGVLTLLLQGGLHYVAATTLAVEAAILHNFCWHTRWTWGDRPRTDRLTRLWRFHLANGLISLAGNAGAMWVLVGMAGMPPLPANLVAVGCCAVVNFLISDRLVFSDAFHHNHLG
jgi:putative flippase GtrA